ncbi:MAG TPA: hypothetical protein VM737_03460 [Gemmatimonadota bacterium]|nr:hypothetical protein [Gemmatimonadota bacterium]
MATLWNDLRHAARLLVRRPGLTLATLLVLGLGLGATAAASRASCAEPAQVLRQE